SLLPQPTTAMTTATVSARRRPGPADTGWLCSTPLRGGTMIALRSVRGWIAVMVLLLATRVGAEGLDDLKDTTPAERAAAQTMMMKEKLSLTDDQLPKVKAINEKYAEQMDPILKGPGGMFMKMG